VPWVAFGQVEVDHDPPDASAASPVLRDDGVGQDLAEPVERAWQGTVLEARKRRLRGQTGAGRRLTVKQQLVDGVVGQGVRVVGVRMPTGHADSNTAPPSELAWGWSNVTTTGRPQSSGNRTDCATVTIVNGNASVCGNVPFSRACLSHRGVSVTTQLHPVVNVPG
jgi:hypothetical protein